MPSWHTHTHTHTHIHKYTQVKERKQGTEKVAIKYNVEEESAESTITIPDVQMHRRIF